MHGLGLSIIEAQPGRVRFTLPVVDRLTHAGGVLCGQAILACMDTAMVFVMMSLNGATDGNFTTVQLQTTFERGVPADVGDRHLRRASDQEWSLAGVRRRSICCSRTADGRPAPPPPTCGCERRPTDQGPVPSVDSTSGRP